MDTDEDWDHMWGCTIGLAKGQYDNELTWPFSGAVTIQLLNWREDKQHREHRIDFAHPGVPTTDKSRVMIGDYAPNSYG